MHESEALAAADQVDGQRRDGAKLPALAGIPISVKDLFDEAGVTTLAGSTVLVGTPAATRNSTVVERLKKAGAVIIGRTNLVEFAYSGLGLNPHYGTPKNAFDRATGCSDASDGSDACRLRSARPRRGDPAGTRRVAPAHARAPQSIKARDTRKIHRTSSYPHREAPSAAQPS